MIRYHARFCNTSCASGFREDRRAGAIYPATLEIDDAESYTGRFWTHEERSLIDCTCAYSTHMHQIEATIAGVKYTGRGMGPTMSWIGRPKAGQNA